VTDDLGREAMTMVERIGVHPCSMPHEQLLITSFVVNLTTPVRRYSYFKDLQTTRGGMAPRKLRKAIEFINNNLDDEQAVGLAAVAGEVQMSYSHFARAFKQSMGVSPNVYMTEQRIARAKKFLSETDLRIADIALRTGFASQSHFTSTFRKLVWTTPKAFRDTR